jgi:nicotinate-nucleotide adenylyltransferase
MRVGLFGGSFDPIHLGHLLIAESVRESASLDSVCFLPTAMAPHKQGQGVSPAKQRVEMLQLALAGFEEFLIDTMEIDRGGVSYTVDTLEALRESRPEDDLFLIMGGDALAELPTWKSPERICQLATPIVVARPGAPPIDLDVIRPLVEPARLAEVESLRVTLPLIEMSSTDLRRRVAERKSIRFRTPRAVEKYIETQKMYRPTDVTSD